MIVSVSRRTDIPAFYSRWFLERLRQGFCLVPNPFDPRKSSRVSLRPCDVDCFIFWTRHPRPLLQSLETVEQDFKSLFFVTLTGYPRLLEPRRPAVNNVLASVHGLARKLGPGRVGWRYDPVVFSELTPPAWHLENFTRLAAALEGATRRVTLSLYKGYRKTRPRLARVSRQGGSLLVPDEQQVREVFMAMAAIARKHGMQARACAQGPALADCGITPGACIERRWLHQELGLALPPGKDPAQRKDCSCLPSKDIGMYDSCLFGCRYCYATSSWAKAQSQRQRHNPEGATLLPVTGLSGDEAAVAVNRKQQCAQPPLPWK